MHPDSDPRHPPTILNFDPVSGQKADPNAPILLQTFVVRDGGDDKRRSGFGGGMGEKEMNGGGRRGSRLGRGNSGDSDATTLTNNSLGTNGSGRDKGKGRAAETGIDAESQQQQQQQPTRPASMGLVDDYGPTMRTRGTPPNWPLPAVPIERLPNLPSVLPPPPTSMTSAPLEYPLTYPQQAATAPSPTPSSPPMSPFSVEVDTPYGSPTEAPLVPKRNSRRMRRAMLAAALEKERVDRDRELDLERERQKENRDPSGTGTSMWEPDSDEEKSGGMRRVRKSGSGGRLRRG